MGAYSGENAVRPRLLSVTQQRLWFLEQLAPGSTQHLVCAGYELRGPLDVDALGAALTSLTARHDALRTNVVSHAGEPRVRIRPPAPIRLTPVTPPADRARDPNGWASDYMSAEAATAFDLAHDPLLRPTLLRLQPDKHVLLLIMHHLVTDAASVQIMVRELAELYRASRAGEPPVLAGPAPSYADFAAWQRDLVHSSPDLDRELAFWTDALGNAPPLTDLPVDRPRPVAQTFRGGSHVFDLPAPLVARLRRLAGRHGASLFMATFAAFALLTSRYSRVGDIVIGVPVAGRVRPQDTATVGFFVNMLGVRTRLGTDPTFLQALTAVRLSTLDAFDHARLPFELLVERLDVERDLSYNPLIQVAFQLLYAPDLSTGTGGRPGTVARWHDLDVHEWGGGTPSGTRFDLELHLRQGGPDEVDGLVCYNADLFDAGTAEELANDYGRLLAEVVDAPDRPLSAVRALHPDADAMVERTRAVDLFDVQVRAHPGAVAVEAGPRRLSFAELAAAAEKAAPELVISGGVATLPSGGPDDWLPYALAAWRLGAAYRRPGGPVVDEDAVLAAHRGAAGWRRWHAGERAVFDHTGSDDTTFDAAVWHPLLAGGTLVVPEPERYEHFGAFLAGSGITRLRLRAPRLAALLDAGLVVPDGCTVEVVGDTSAALAAAVRDVCRSAYALHGTREVPVCVVRDLTRPEADGDGLPRLWQPVVPLRICDADGRFRPWGALGEVCVPHRAADGTGLRRTGWLGRLRWDGALELHGLVDELVTVRGTVVPAYRIERHLRGHPAVARAVVVNRAGERLVACLVPAPGETLPEARRLRAYLRRLLPQYLIPTFEWFTELPAGPDGRPDRVALSRGGPVAAPRVYAASRAADTE
jgi:non-ribosomal peptide synthetase component F